MGADVSFRSPATALQVTAALEPGTAVITDKSDAGQVLLNETAAVYLAARDLPGPAATYYVGDFDNLQVVFQRAAGAAGYAVQLYWWADEARALLLGVSTFSTPDGTAFFDSIPVQGPYFSILAQATVYGAGQQADFRIMKRKGHGGMIGAVGDGVILSASAVGLGAGGISGLFSAGTINAGAASWCVWSSQSGVIGLLYRIDSGGGAATIAAFHTTTTRGQTVPVILPTHKIACQVVNLAGVAADITMSVIALTRR